MRIASLVLGIFAGLFGLLGGMCGVAVGAVGGAFDVEGADQVVNLGWLAFVAAISGMVGASFALHRPKIASGVMFVSGIVGLIAISFAFIFSAIFFGLASLLAFLGRNEKKSTTA